MLRDADRVFIIPGYGMAVANAQHTISALTTLLKDKVWILSPMLQIYIHTTLNSHHLPVHTIHTSIIIHTPHFHPGL